MSWARFDDQFHADKDLDAVCDSAVALHCVATTWCSSQETDGVVPFARVPKLTGGSNPAAIADLLRIGWWIKLDDHYQIRSYLKYNPSHAELEAQRVAHAQRTDKWRKKRVTDMSGDNGCDASQDGTQDGTQDDPVTLLPARVPGPIPIPIPRSHSQSQESPNSPQGHFEGDGDPPDEVGEAAKESSDDDGTAKSNGNGHKPPKPPPRLLAEQDPRFAEFVKLYPKKAIEDARRAWDAVKPTDSQIDIILEGLHRRLDGTTLSADERHSCAGPGVFLRWRRWQDEDLLPGLTNHQRNNGASTNGYRNSNGHKRNDGTGVQADEDTYAHIDPFREREFIP
jgi:hypothetical protein